MYTFKIKDITSSYPRLQNVLLGVTGLSSNQEKTAPEDPVSKLMCVFISLRFKFQHTF